MADTDRSGKISVDELQKGLAPPMPERRLALVREAFRRLDKTGDGVVKIDDLAQAYDTSKHPLVLSRSPPLSQLPANDHDHLPLPLPLRPSV